MDVHISAAKLCAVDLRKNLGLDGHADPPQKVIKMTRLSMLFKAESSSFQANYFLNLIYLTGNGLSNPCTSSIPTSGPSTASGGRWRSLGHTWDGIFASPRRNAAPIDAMLIEYELRSAGITLVLMNGPARPPIPRGQRIDVADLITSMLEYDSSGKFRRDLAEKLIHAKIMLAKAGFSIGGEPPYGFRRWLCSVDGVKKRELTEHEIVKLPCHHVAWLPTALEELKVVRRILGLIETTPASRIARILNEEKVPAPKAGRIRKVQGIPIEMSGLWSQNTIKAIARHPILMAVMRYNYRSEGDQMRFTPEGPRSLGEDDYNRTGKPKTVVNTPDKMVLTPAKCEAITTPEQHERIQTILGERGKSQRGKARAQGEAPNPLGARIFDLDCGWPMYRYARRGQWRYCCGLYQNSEARCCHHNVVDGATATRVVLGSLQQRLANPSSLAKLKARRA